MIRPALLRKVVAGRCHQLTVHYLIIVLILMVIVLVIDKGGDDDIGDFK